MAYSPIEEELDGTRPISWGSITACEIDIPVTFPCGFWEITFGVTNKDQEYVDKNSNGYNFDFGVRVCLEAKDAGAKDDVPVPYGAAVPGNTVGMKLDLTGSGRVTYFINGKIRDKCTMDLYALGWTNQVAIYPCVRVRTNGPKPPACEIRTSDLKHKNTYCGFFGEK